MTGPRVLALTRTSSDEEAVQARAPFDGLAEVELVDVGRRQAAAVVARLGLECRPAWLYVLGESVIVAVGSPEPIVQRLREQASVHLEEPSQDHGAVDVRPQVGGDVAASRAAEPAAEPAAEARARLSREQVLEVMEGRADELHPGSQVSRLSRRLNTERPRVVLSRSEEQ